MGVLGDRINGWVEERIVVWRDRLRGWMASWVMKGMESFLVDIEPTSIEQAKTTIDRIRANPATPLEVKAYLDKFQAGGFSPLIILGIIMAVAMIIQTVQTIWQPSTKQMSYGEERAAKTFRFDPISVVTAWRRDPAQYTALFDDLRDLGFSDGRIEVLKRITLAIPNAPDIVRFALREVYTPEVAEKYGQFQDFPEAAMADADIAGLSHDLLMKYWAAHWTLPSASEGFEMLHRAIITEDELKTLLKANDIMPFWRDQLIKLTWNIPTRVDVRRFWDMRTIDEPRLREIYQGLGYHDKDLEDYVLWTKIYVDFPDLLARYKNGWISIDDVKRELIAMGMKPERANTLIEEKIKKAAPERVAAEKDLSRTDIINGVKKGVITRAEASELLIDLGYDAAEAEYILAISIPPDEEEKVVTARELTKADILGGLKAGIITEDQALAKLLELRYTAADASFLLKIYKATVKPPEEPKLKEASKADIVTAVKKGLITPEEAYLMLIDIGFSAEASLFILSIVAASSPFSPMSFEEFKDMTQKWRKATGREVIPMSDELKSAGAELIARRKDVDVLRAAALAEERLLIPGAVLPVEATAKLKEIQVALHRAESALAEVQIRYDSLVARWRHA